ncbi:MAG: cell division protein FtsZ [Candidatus Neomarinimicrobiota bacterium]
MLIEYDGLQNQRARIKVIGVGGAGGNAIQRMITSNLTDVEFIAINTDAQALSVNEAEIKIQIGASRTRGLGAGTDPSIGYHAAVECKERIEDIVRDTDMVIITAGMGGGTGTGAAPVVAEIAKNSGALTIAFVTKPFIFEGSLRSKQAEQGIKRLREHVDSLIVIPNEKIFDIISDDINFVDGFAIADSVLNQGTAGISNLITKHGLINLDFADVKTIVNRKGDAVIGVGLAGGNDRAIKAVKEAIHSPLLENNSIRGAKGLLINFTGSEDMKLNEVRNAASMIFEEAGDKANIVFGALIDEKLKDSISVTVIATGLNTDDIENIDTDEHKSSESINTDPDYFFDATNSIPEEPKIKSKDAEEQIAIFDSSKKGACDIQTFGDEYLGDMSAHIDEADEDNKDTPAYLRNFFARK